MDKTDSNQSYTQRAYAELKAENDTLRARVAELEDASKCFMVGFDGACLIHGIDCTKDHLAPSTPAEQESEGECADCTHYAGGAVRGRCTLDSDSSTSTDGYCAEHSPRVPPPPGETLPECFRCGKAPTANDINSSGNVHHVCGDPDLDRPILFQTRDTWIRYCAESTPCRECGEMPITPQLIKDKLGCGECDDDWYTYAEWLARNEREDGNKLDNGTARGGSGDDILRAGHGDGVVGEVATLVASPRAEALRRARRDINRVIDARSQDDSLGWVWIVECVVRVLDHLEAQEGNRARARKALGTCFVQDRDEHRLPLAISHLAAEGSDDE